MTELLLTNYLSTAGYGIYAFAKKVLAIGNTFSTSSSTTALYRYLPKYSDDRHRQNGILGLSFGFSLFVSSALGVGLYAAGPWMSSATFDTSTTVDVFRILALVFPSIAFVKNLSGTFRALQLIRLSILLDKVAQPALILLAVGVVVFVEPSVQFVIFAILFANVVTVGIGSALFVVFTDNMPALNTTRSETTDYFNYSLPLVISHSTSLLFRRVDIFMVGFLLTSDAVGMYNIALLMSGLLLLPLSGFSQLFPPIASKLYEEGSMQRLSEVYATVTRWSIMLTSVGAAGMVIYRKDLFYLFGTEYVAGSSIFVVLVVGQVVNSSVGPAGHLLEMTDHQYVLLANRVAMSTLNVGLNYVLIQEYGAIGAAIATAGVFALLNVIRLVEISILEGLFPYDRSSAKFLPALGGATVAMYGLDVLSTHELTFLVGGPAGVVIYLVLLYTYGMTAVDRKTMKRFVSNFLD